MSVDDKPKLTLDIENLDIQDIVKKAIYSSLDKKVKDELVEKSLDYLTKESGYGYSNKSPLQESFHNAIRAVANDLVIQYVKDDEIFKNKIGEIYKLSIEKFLEKATPALNEKVAEHVASAMTRDKEWED